MLVGRIRGHRVWVSPILAEYPGLEPDDLRALVAYGAEMTSKGAAKAALEQGA